jgi:hypothetical protein
LNHLKILTISSISLWLGVMGFFSFVAAPTVFTTLDRESAGRLVGAILPRYHFFGIIMGLLALAGVLGRAALKRGTEIEWGVLGLTLLMLALTVYSMLVLLPQAESARLAMRSMPASSGMVSEAALAFGRAHRLSVTLNLLTMLAGLTLVFVEGFRTRL